MWRPSLFLGLLILSTAGAQGRLVKQVALLPSVTLSAPGYAVRAEVRPAVVYPESGPNIGPYFQFSPAQVRVVLDKAGEAKWKSQYATDRPPAFITVTPVQNWLTLFKTPALKADVEGQLSALRAINTGCTGLAQAQASVKGLPYLPLVNAAQAVSGAARRVNTPQLQGVRYLTIYAQETSVAYPRSAVFYTFQGLSRDGKYVVSMQVPYSPASFPKEAGSKLMSTNEWQRYRTQARAQLDTESTRLATLDRLVQSIRIR